MAVLRSKKKQLDLRLFPFLSFLADLFELDASAKTFASMRLPRFFSEMFLVMHSAISLSEIWLECTLEDKTVSPKENSQYYWPKRRWYNG